MLAHCGGRQSVREHAVVCTLLALQVFRTGYVPVLGNAAVALATVVCVGPDSPTPTHVVLCCQRNTLFTTSGSIAALDRSNRGSALARIHVGLNLYITFSSRLPYKSPRGKGSLSRLVVVVL